MKPRTTNLIARIPMNAARLALSFSFALVCAALAGCTHDSDESEHAPAAQAQAKSGDGYGFEFLADKVSASQERLAPAPAEVAGRLAPEMIRDVVRAGFPAISACATARNAAPVDVTVTFSIGEDGVPLAVHATKTADANLGTCASNAIAALRFPRSHGGEAEVIYPLVF